MQGHDDRMYCVQSSSGLDDKARTGANGNANATETRTTQQFGMLSAVLAHSATRSFA